MADLPPAAPITNAPSVTAPPTGNVAVIEAVLNNAPDKLQSLARQLELSGTITQAPTNNAVTINTVAGALTFLLPQIAQAQQDKLLQQLMTLFQTQRPLTVVMQPGNPPAQAFLLLPPVNTPPQNQSGTVNAVKPPPVATQPAAPPLQNMLLSAVVLPKGIVAAPVSAPPPYVGAPPVTSPLPNPAAENAGPISPPSPTFASPSPTFASPSPASVLGSPSAIPVSNVGLPPFPAAIPDPGAALPELLETAVVQETLAKLEGQMLPNLIAPQNPSALQNTPLPEPPEVLAASAKPQVYSTPFETSSAPIVAGMQNTPQTVTRSLSLAPPPPGQVFQTSMPQSPVPQNVAPKSFVEVLFQPGTELTVRIDSVIPQPGPNASPGTSPLPAPQAPNQVIATVAGNGPGGQPILKIGDAVLYVRQPINLPPGSQLAVTITPVRSDAPTALTLPRQQEFDSLPQIIAAIAQTDPTAARVIVESFIPQPSEALPGALLFFLSAIKQGDVRSWLGSGAVDLLTRAGKIELIGKLTGDLQQMGQTARDSVVGEWKSYPVPIHDQGQFQVINFYVHGQQNHGNQASKEQTDVKSASGQVRFLIDVRMSKLGAMQLDGFLKGRHLDMIVRSEHVLPFGLPQELRQTYTKALAAIDYAGGIVFQTGRQNWLNIQKPSAAKAVVT